MLKRLVSNPVYKPIVALEQYAGNFHQIDYSAQRHHDDFRSDICYVRRNCDNYQKQGTVETVAGSPGDRIQAIRNIVTQKQYAKIDGTMIDLFTASLIVQIYDALKPENQIKFASFKAGKMGEMAYKLAK